MNGCFHIGVFLGGRNKDKLDFIVIGEINDSGKIEITLNSGKVCRDEYCSSIHGRKWTRNQDLA